MRRLFIRRQRVDKPGSGCIRMPPWAEKTFVVEVTNNSKAGKTAPAVKLTIIHKRNGAQCHRSDSGKNLIPSVYLYCEPYREIIGIKEHRHIKWVMISSRIVYLLCLISS